MTTPEPSLVAADGRDALAYVIIKPGPDGNVVIDAAASGISKPHAAWVLRQVADRWAPPTIGASQS